MECVFSPSQGGNVMSSFDFCMFVCCWIVAHMHQKFHDCFYAGRKCASTISWLFLCWPAIWRENDCHVIVPQALHGQHKMGEQKLVETICIVWVCEYGFYDTFPNPQFGLSHNIEVVMAFVNFYVSQYLFVLVLLPFFVIFSCCFFTSFLHGSFSLTLRGGWFIWPEPDFLVYAGLNFKPRNVPINS